MSAPISNDDLVAGSNRDQQGLFSQEAAERLLRAGRMLCPNACPIPSGDDSRGNSPVL
jgi:hypothetical protein